MGVHNRSCPLAVDMSILWPYLATPFFSTKFIFLFSNVFFLQDTFIKSRKLLSRTLFGETVLLTGYEALFFI